MHTFHNFIKIKKLIFQSKIKLKIDSNVKEKEINEPINKTMI